MIVFAAFFLLAAVPGSGAGGHKKGFLALDPWESVSHDESEDESHDESDDESHDEGHDDESPDDSQHESDDWHESHDWLDESRDHPSSKERRMWDDFQDDERKLNQGKSGDVLMAPPGGPPPPSHIMPVDYTVEVLIGPPPCEKRIQKCSDESKFCRRMLEDLGTKIAASVSRLRDLANINPLLNTLQIRSDVQSKAPLIAFAQNLDATRSLKQTSIPVSPVWKFSDMKLPQAPAAAPPWTRINPVIKPVDTAVKVDWAALARLKKAKDDLKKTEEKTFRRSKQPYLHQEFRSPDGVPLSRIPKGMERLPEALHDHAPDVAQGIAQHIAEELPKRVLKAAANQLNAKCDGMQTLMLDDCLSFAQACKDDLEEKKHRFGALGRTIRDHEEERQKY